MKTYIAVIEGRKPLLMHRYDDTEDMEAASRKIHVKKKDPREEAEKVAYRNAAGELYIPGYAVERCLCEAGASHKQRGSRKSLKYIVPAAVLVFEDQIVIRDSEGNALTDYEVDSQPVVIPSTKGRIMRHRPKLNRWHAEFTLEIDDDMLEPNLIHQLLVEGGSKLGLLDYRPRHGKFAVVSWAILAQPDLKLAAD